MIGTLAVDGCAVTFGSVRRGMGGLRPPPSPLLTVPNVTAHPSHQQPVYQSLYFYMMVRCSAVLINGQLIYISLRAYSVLRAYTLVVPASFTYDTFHFPT